MLNRVETKLRETLGRSHRLIVQIQNLRQRIAQLTAERGPITSKGTMMSAKKPVRSDLKEMRTDGSVAVKVSKR